MAIADQTRADLRTALTYHTDSKLTLAADLDYYLNAAELEVFKDWRRFDPGLFRAIRDSASTDANGILLVDANFSRIEFLETAAHQEYLPIKDMRQTPYGTGYYFVGFDQTNNQRQIKVISGGNPVASTTLYWYNIASLLMGTATTVKSAIPNEHRRLITFKAAFLYYRDKGSAFITSKEDWKRDYVEALREAETWYKNVSRAPEFVTSMDPDAGGAGFVTVRQS